MTSLDSRILELWQQNRGKPLSLAFAYRREARSYLYAKFNAELHMGDPEYDEGQLMRDRDEAEHNFKSLMKMARFELRYAKERRHARAA